MGCTVHFGAFDEYFVISTISKKSDLKVQLDQVENYIYDEKGEILI